MTREQESDTRLLVRKGELALPFSRGLLLTTLLRAGVGLQDAEDVTAGLLAAFTKEGQREVTPGQIREAVVSILRARELHQEAKLYVLMVKVSSIRGTVTILIGGAAGVGKSTVAAELARRLGIRRVIGTDIIREILRSRAPDTSCLQESTFELADQMTEEDVLKGKGYREQVVLGFLKQCRAMNGGIQAVLRRGETEGIKLVLHGANIVPSLLAPELRQEGVHRIPFILSLKDEELHVQRFQRRGSETRRAADRYIAHIREIRHIQDALIEDAGKMGVPVVENRELEETVNIMLKVISERLLGN